MPCEPESTHQITWLSHYLLVLKNVFLKAANHTLLYTSESWGGKLWSSSLSHWLFWREKFCNKIKEFPDSLLKKLELCTMTDLHSTVPLTQGTVPGASFWGLVSGKFSANLSRAFSQFFLLLFWRRWTSSIEDGLPVPKPACARRSWSWICYQKLSRGLTVQSKHIEMCCVQLGILTIILWFRKDWCTRKTC